MTPPVPGPPVAGSRRWFQERPSDYPWEQDGLEHVKRLMPQAEPFRAWATFSFTAQSGRIHECDLLVAVPGGLYLVELKAHPGRVVNQGDEWLFYEQGREWPRTLRNPLHFTDLKCKELKQRLEWAAKRKGMRTLRIPRVQPAIFLTHRGLESHLDDVQRTRVYGRDEDSTGLDWIWRDLLSTPPQREGWRVDTAFSRDVLPGLLSEIGIRAATAHLRFGDDWQLDQSVLDAGPAWEDRLATRSGFVTESGRVRIYLTEEQAGEERRAQVERAARREYQVLQGITHRGIAQPVLIREHQGRPAILFRHDAADLRLDSYLTLHAARLTPEVRLDLVRQLAEAVRYAHSRSLYHRALAARSVYVSARPDGRAPVLRVIDWQTAARDFDAGVSSSIGVSSLGDDVVADSAGPYLAPEFDTPYPDPADLDLFGLGAISYLILTGRPPATDRPTMVERVRTDSGLHLHGVDGTLPQPLDDLVFAATRSSVDERLESAEKFLLGLDRTERDSAQPAQPRVDPLTATAGQRVDDEWTVERILGTGSSSRALLLQRVRESDDGEEQREYRVLKVALDEEKAVSLRSEAEILDRVGGAHIVRKLGGPRTLADRTVIDLQYAGGSDLDGGTLGTLLRSEGRLSYHDLERFGRDLFSALDILAGEGVRHRDIKPDNLAIFRRADRSRQLMLLDFSLAAAAESDVGVGTRGYLDPFLGSLRRPLFDDHAERYAAAVTLHEMASKQKPEWGDGLTDPRTTSDETPALASDQFDPALKDGLITFFRRAFHRDVGRRFDTLKQMDDAWRAVFTTADQRVPVEGDSPEAPEAVRETLAAEAGLDTTLEQAGLSPRAVSVAAGYAAGTVGELLKVRTTELARARGAGAAVRKELIRRHKQWAPLLRVPEPEPDVADGARLSVEGLVAVLTRRAGTRPTKRDAVVRLTLGLDPALPGWPTQTAIAKAASTSQPTVSKTQQALFEEWAESPHLADVREILVDALAGAGRVMTAVELATVVRARLGSTSADGQIAALGVVRAAAESEVWAGEHAESEDADPRLAVLRQGGRVLLALESLAGSDDPSPSELGDLATALGAAADELAVEEPLPGRNAVLRRLRDVPAPDGMVALPDTRLVTLASAASKDALVSPNGELYPRSLDLVPALRISQAAAGVRRKDPGVRFDTGIASDALLSRVRARFPQIRLDDGITYVQMEEALQKAGFLLKYDTRDRRFYPEAPPAPLASSTSLPHRPPGVLVRDGIRRQLDRSAERGGFVALTLRGRDLPGTADALADTFEVRPLDVGATFLAELRTIAGERGRDWSAVLKSDLKFTESAQMSRGLDSWVRFAWERVGERIDAACGPDTLLFLHDAGLLARYAESGGREMLVRLQAAGRSPNRAPHGVWLLCPGDSAVGAPQLDGMVVEVIDESERVVLDRDWLKELRAPAESIA
ncbi:BREX system serine/threonine kinase PglW [Pseudonocardia alni subsp. carboxydivorans]|uniref:non-specific serine/threonine protein kinase n=1 Tax=Pseudonocardia alni subsp. carboxydivorans TaxID=415010 RepID=A0ABU9AG58_PSEA5